MLTEHASGVLLAGAIVWHGTVIKTVVLRTAHRFREDYVFGSTQLPFGAGALR